MSQNISGFTDNNYAKDVTYTKNSTNIYSNNGNGYKTGIDDNNFNPMDIGVVDKMEERKNGFDKDLEYLKNKKSSTQ